MKATTILAVSIMFVFGFVSHGTAMDAAEVKPGQSDEQKLEETVKAMGTEMSRMMIEGIKLFLDQELKRLKGKVEARDKAQSQIPAYEAMLKKNPRDPATHLALGKYYDEMEDGANAIIHTQKAEELFVAQKDVKGTAESRRNLRMYYEKYGFKAEDFNVSK